jgi:hypothetical protein
MASPNSNNPSSGGGQPPVPLPIHPFFAVPDLSADGDFEVLGVNVHHSTLPSIMHPFDFSDSDSNGPGRDVMGNDNPNAQYGGTSDHYVPPPPSDSDQNNIIHSDFPTSDYPYNDHQTPVGSSPSDSDASKATHSDYPVSDSPPGTDLHLPDPGQIDSDNGGGNDHQSAVDGKDRSGDSDETPYGLGGHDYPPASDHGDRTDTDHSTQYGLDRGGTAGDGPLGDNSDQDAITFERTDLGRLFNDGTDTSGHSGGNGGNTGGGTGISGGGGVIGVFWGIGGGEDKAFGGGKQNPQDSDNGHGNDYPNADKGDQTVIPALYGDTDSAGCSSATLALHMPATYVVDALAIAEAIVSVGAILSIPTIFVFFMGRIALYEAISGAIASLEALTVSGKTAEIINAAIQTLKKIDDNGPLNIIQNAILGTISNLWSAWNNLNDQATMAALNKFASLNPGGCIPANCANQWSDLIAKDGSTFPICQDGFGADTGDNQNPGGKHRVRVETIASGAPSGNFVPATSLLIPNLTPFSNNGSFSLNPFASLSSLDASNLTPGKS